MRSANRLEQTARWAKLQVNDSDSIAGPLQIVVGRAHQLQLKVAVLHMEMHHQHLLDSVLATCDTFAVYAPGVLCTQLLKTDCGFGSYFQQGNGQSGRKSIFPHKPNVAIGYVPVIQRYCWQT